jgi:Alcohol dehydrogenase GroES-like domain
MATNRGVVYVGPGKVEVRSIDFPKLVDPRGRRCEHGVILKIVSTNICGSDQHMVRGRTTAQPGLVLGHEITGEVIEAGRDVQYIGVGDLVSVPFNVACGRCRTCKDRATGVCLNVNPERAGGAYGYVDMGGWIGGQAEYVMVPYADFNLLPFPDKDQAMEKIRDLTCLTDILPTGYHGCVSAASPPARRCSLRAPDPSDWQPRLLRFYWAPPWSWSWTSTKSGSRKHVHLDARRSTSRKAAPWPTTSSRSSVSRRSTARSTAWASRPRVMAAPISPRSSSTSSWT